MLRRHPPSQTCPLGRSSRHLLALATDLIFFCRTCDAAFYGNTRGKPKLHCKPCYLKWSTSQGRTTKHATNSPASARADSSEGASESEQGLFAELEQVVRRGVSFEDEPPPPPPPPQPPPPPPPQPPPASLVPEPTNISQLLEQLSRTVPPPPPRPKMVDRGCQTGLAADTEECAPASHCPLAPRPLSHL